MDDLTTYDDNKSSADNYRLAVIIVTVCMGLIGAYAIYAVFTSGIDWGFDINWNCFKSPVFPIFCIIGFFLQFFNWQHSSMDTWIGTKEKNSDKIKWKKSDDIMDFMFGNCMMPLISHLIIYPLAIGALLWYPIMGLIHVVGKASPFLISALVAALVFAFYVIGNKVRANRFRVTMLVIFTLIEGGILFGTAYFMRNHDSISFFGGSSKSSDSIDPIGTCTIIGNGVNLRVGPGTEFDKSGYSVSEGESYPLLEEADGWVKIDYNGTPLWMSRKYCALSYNDNISEGEDDDLGCYVEEDENDVLSGSVSVTTGSQDMNNSGSVASDEGFEVVRPVPGARVYTGKLDGKYEIVMQIYNSDGNSYLGTYYYTKYKTPIALSGKIDNNNNTLSLEEMPNGFVTGYFIGRLTSDGFDGIWQDAKDTKTMDCTLRYVKTNKN